MERILSKRSSPCDCVWQLAVVAYFVLVPMGMGYCEDRYEDTIEKALAAALELRDLEYLRSRNELIRTAQLDHVARTKIEQIAKDRDRWKASLLADVILDRAARPEIYAKLEKGLNRGAPHETARNINSSVIDHLGAKAASFLLEILLQEAIPESVLFVGIKPEERREYYEKITSAILTPPAGMGLPAQNVRVDNPNKPPPYAQIRKEYEDQRIVPALIAFLQETKNQQYFIWGGVLAVQANRRSQTEQEDYWQNHPEQWRWLSTVLEMKSTTGFPARWRNSSFTKWALLLEGSRDKPERAVALKRLIELAQSDPDEETRKAAAISLSRIKWAPVADLQHWLAVEKTDGVIRALEETISKLRGDTPENPDQPAMPSPPKAP